MVPSSSLNAVFVQLNELMQKALDERDAFIAENDAQRAEMLYEVDELAAQIASLQQKESELKSSIEELDIQRSQKETVVQEIHAAIAALSVVQPYLVPEAACVEEEPSDTAVLLEENVPEDEFSEEMLLLEDQQANGTQQIHSTFAKGMRNLFNDNGSARGAVTFEDFIEAMGLTQESSYREIFSGRHAEDVSLGVDLDRGINSKFRAYVANQYRKLVVLHTSTNHLTDLPFSTLTVTGLISGSRNSYRWNQERYNEIVRDIMGTQWKLTEFLIKKKVKK